MYLPLEAPQVAATSRDVSTEAAALIASLPAPHSNGVATAATNGNATTTAHPEAPGSTPAAASTPAPFLVDANPETSTNDRLQPLTTQDGPRRAAGGDEFYGGSAAGSTVLIVDDDFRNIFALTALLERGKLDVVAAESGADALGVLERRNDIDLVLMDIMMPEINGYETMKAIRRRPKLADLPIIAVTGKVVGGERARCLAAGASDYIPKPVDTAELLQALSQWFPATPRRHTPRS